MRPRVPAVFATTAADLLERVVPAISPPYHQGTIGMIASMLSLVGDEWDRAASRRIEENDRLREIFRDAAKATNNPALNARLTKLAETSDGDFRISALETGNCTLRAALIELHAQIETESGAEARRSEDIVGRKLLRSTERWRFSSARF
jgi:hypothetical protein